MGQRIGAIVAACLMAASLFVGLYVSDRASAASWTVTVVDSLGTVGSYTSIAVDAAGRPHISYEDASAQALRHAWHDGVSWNLESVRAVGCPEIFTSLALDSLGRPHIAYHSCGSLMHSWWSGAGWVHEVVDGPNVGRHPSIALDSADRPRISYYDDGNRNLLYAEWDGMTWNIQAADTANLVGEWNSLALDSLERPQISYFRRNSNNIRHVRWDGAAWVGTLVDSVGQVGFDSSLALDSNDYGHIAYHSSSARVLKYARWDGALWNVQSVDTVGDGGVLGSQALDLDAAESPQIAYQDITLGNLKYARWTGTSWNLTVVDPSPNDVGSWPSLAIDATGVAHVSYYDATAGDLKYAVLSNLPPTTPSTPTGPTSGVTGTSYAYSTSSADPDGDPIMYTFDWGDAMTSDTGYNASGIPVSLSHSWSTPGIYAVRARAKDGGGATSGWSSPLNVTIVSLPTAPLSLGAVAGDSNITLTWSAPVSDGGSPITNYRIYRGLTSGSQVFLVQVGNVLTYVDVGLTNGQAYYYNVTAVNWAGEGPSSTEASATPAGIPGAPTGLAAAGGDAQVTLTWSMPASDGGSPVANYRVHRGLSPGGEAFLVQVGNVSTHVDLGLSNGVTYYYEVTAVNAIGEGPGSNEANATPSAPPTIPSAPASLAALAGNAQADLSWTAPTDDGGSSITNYRVHRGLSPGGEAFLVQIGNVLTHTDLGLTNGVTYYYEVTAVNAIGEGPASNEANATPSAPPTAPSAPVGLATVPGNAQADLSWTAPLSDGGSPVTNYRIHRGLSSGGEVFLVQIGNVLAHTDLGLANGVTYYYEVTAVNAIGQGPASNEANATPATTPSAPGSLTATPGDTLIILTWSAPVSDGGSPITNYRIHRGLSSGGEVFLTMVGNVSTHTDLGLTNGVPYHYTVTAVNSPGEGPASNEVNATPTAAPTVPSPPQTLAALAGNARVDLTWSAPVSDGGSSITNYSIYRGLSSGGEVFLTLIGNITAYTDLGLTNGVTYYYTVGAVNGVGESAQSNEASAIPATVPTPPWSLLASAASAQVTLTWFAPASDGGLTITNYRVYRGLSPGAEIFLVEIGALLTHVDVGLVNGQEYCYAVSAVNPIGEGSQSTESCATPTAGPTIPTAPQGLAAFGGNAQVVLTWAAPASDGGSAITNYRVHRSATSSTETFLAEIGNLLTYTDATVTNGLTYYYFVTARNGVGEGPASTEANATPTAAANLPPTCTITAPVPDETISSVYVIRGIATDSDGVVQYVEVRIDGGAWTQATPGATWSLAVNTTALAEGQHTIRARSFDGTSYSSEASVTVAVRNVSPPPGDSIFEQRWYWAALLIAIISAVLFLLLFLSRRRKEKEEEVVPVPADGPQGGEGPIGEMPPPEGPEPLLEQDENPLE